MTRRERKLSMMLVLAALGAVIFLFFISENVVEAPGGTLLDNTIEQVKEVVANPNADIEPQKPLSNPPKFIKAIYATNWSAGSEKKLAYFFDLFNTTELNAIVLDIKDYTGVVGYEPDVAAVKKYGAWERRIPKINKLIKRFHDANVYVIGRIAVFQDGALVTARPDLALHSSSTGQVWGDRKNVHWLDTASMEVWDYNVEIARDALSRGFDEINFDYIRFPSDGSVSDIRYPIYDGALERHEIVRNFFSYLREKLPGAKISGDLFGEVTYVKGDIGVGQRLEDSLEAFDFVAPMIYPSHYSKNFRGLPNSAEAPYEVIRYSMEQAVARHKQYRAQHPASSTVELTEFRPWLQDFDLGADYDAAKVRAQIQALDDINASSTSDLITGWLLWNPSNIYTREALLTE